MQTQNETVKSFLKLFIVIVFILLGFFLVVSFEFIRGNSMEPNYLTGEIVLVNKALNYFGEFKRSDVVVLISPGDNAQHFVKRIVGIPGDTVEIVDCSVFITGDEGENGAKNERYMLEESYLSKKRCTELGSFFQFDAAITVGPGEYFVLGDNRYDSADSRLFGLIEENRLIGKVFFRVWPVWSFGSVG